MVLIKSSENTQNFWIAFVTIGSHIDWFRINYKDSGKNTNSAYNTLTSDTIKQISLIEFLDIVLFKMTWKSKELDDMLIAYIRKALK